MWLTLALSGVASAQGVDAGQGAHGPARAVRLGIIPAIARERTQAELSPIVTYLGQQLGEPAELVIAKDYADISGMLARHELDAAILFPLAYVQARAAMPELSLLACSVRQGKAAYRGYIVARRDSPFHQLSDLRGKRFAFVDPSSTSGYLYPTELFLREKLIQSRKELPAFFSEVQFRKSHDGVLRAVLAGEAEAGAMYDGELAQSQRLGVDSGELRILARTDAIPHEAVVAAPGVPEPLRQRLKAALVSLDTRTATGREVLRPLATELKFNGFVTCGPAHFDPIERMLEGRTLEGGR